MNQIDNEALVASLEGIVTHYTEEITPYALQLVN